MAGAAGCHIIWNEKVLSASSGQFVHRDIATTYKTKDGKNPDNNNERWFFASDLQVDAFNKDIEQMALTANSTHILRQAD